MPAKSRKQKGAAGATLREKRGGPKAKGAGHQMAQSMSERQLKEYATTPRKGLPAKAKKRTVR